MFIFDFVAETILDQILDWIYGKIIGFLNDFFVMMNNMGVELFELPWVNAVTTFFSYLGWALFGVGLVVGAFECAIEYQGGRGSIKDTAMNQLQHDVTDYGGKSVHGSTGQPVLAVCIPARNVRFGDYGHYQCRKHWSDSTAGVNVCIFSGNRKSHSDDFLCSHDGVCSNQSVLCQLKKRWNPLNPDSGWKPLYVLCSQRIHRWIYPVVQAGHWHLYHCVFAVHYLNRRTYGI